MPHTITIWECQDCGKLYDTKATDLILKEKQRLGNSIESLLKQPVDGTRYKKCACWRFCPGNAEACFDLCSVEQRNACEHEFDT